MAKLKTGRHTSAIKAHRQSDRRARRNRALKSKAKDLSKQLMSQASKDKEKAGSLLKETSSAWDKAAKKGAVHWKTAARRKSRLAAKLKK